MRHLTNALRRPAARRLTHRLALAGSAALLLAAVVAVTVAWSGTSEAERRMPGPSTTPKPYGILRLDAKKKFPAKAIPKVGRAKLADRAQTAQTLGRSTAEDLTVSCPATTVDLGTWCLSSATYDIDPEQNGQTDFLFASNACVDAGGWLPTAEQLVGAADRVKLSSTIDDDRLTASIDEDPTDGLKDRVEMTSTLVTTRSGSAAAGSPADPEPQSLQYVTVFDNRNRGGFAGSKPVTAAERFRCAFPKGQQGEQSEEG